MNAITLQTFVRTFFHVIEGGGLPLPKQPIVKLSPMIVLSGPSTGFNEILLGPAKKEIRFTGFVMYTVYSNKTVNTTHT